MKILTVHNRYKYRGGEDEAYEAEHTLLTQKGHEVRQILFDNSQLATEGLFRIGLQGTWSRSSYRIVRDQIAGWRPDLLDVHNFFPLASPSIYYAARKLRVPVVQTLHNYRLLCPSANFYRNGVVCEDCTRHLVPWPGVRHRCYRGSALETGAVALMTTTHRLLRTWAKAVSVYFVLSEFAKQKFVENGFPGTRIAIKCNLIFDRGRGTGGGAFLYAGRLSPEKGIATMLQAITLTRTREARFQIIGEGPLEAVVREAALRDPRITYFGRLPLAEVMDAMGSACAVLMPSEWYEPFGRVAVEALSVGTPVICTGLGAVSEIVENGKTGFHVRPLDPADLARVLEQTCAANGVLAGMREDARKAYEQNYSPERGYEMLLRGYRRAISGACE